LTDDLLHTLRERVKELTALHKTARILQDETKPVAGVLQALVALLPPAWQYPEITCARIQFGEYDVQSISFAESRWVQKSAFTTRNGEVGSVEVFYREERPLADEGPFLKEERDLIDSLADMLCSYFQHKLADQALQKAHDELEQLVRARTEQLRRLASQLSLTEARERRVIAEDLHDHIGQALAYTKMNVAQFRGNAIFCGFEDKIDEILSLLDKTIRYTRDLTVEISPPVLYELGLEAGLVWLGEREQKAHALKVVVDVPTLRGQLSEDAKVTLFKSVQELLANAAKHARARRVDISMSETSGGVIVIVHDDGCGFEPEKVTKFDGGSDRFGLFSIRERIDYLGGQMEITSQPGQGTTVTLHVPLLPQGGGS
jgi:two-component system, NarL family, sensor kinase